MEPLIRYPAPTAVWPSRLNYNKGHPARDATQLAWERWMAANSAWTHYHASDCEIWSASSLAFRTLRLDWWKLAPPDTANGVGCKAEHRYYGIFDSNASQLSRGRNSWVIDVGGHIGDVTIPLAHAYPNAKVVVLEPNPLNYRVLLRNLRLNQLTDRVWPMPLALTAHGEHVSVPVCTHGGYSYKSNHASYCQTDMASVSKTEFHSSRTIGSYRPGDEGIFQQHIAESITLSALMAHLNTSELTALKLDCEGCEYQLFNSHQWSDLRGSVLHVMGEMHGIPGSLKAFGGVDCNSLEEIDAAIGLRNAYDACADVPGWSDAAGKTCDWYSRSGVCKNGVVVEPRAAGGDYLGSAPELNCCVCGRSLNLQVGSDKL